MKEYVAARWILPVSRPPIPHGFLAIEDGRISELGSWFDLPEGLRPAYNPERDQTLLTPGLVNAHAHLELSFPHRVPKADGQTMTDWLLGVLSLTRPAEAGGTHPAAEKRARIQRGLAEMIATGTTCVNDVSGDGASLDVLAKAGVRARVALEFFHPGFETLFLEPLIQRFQSTADKYAGSDIVSVGLSPHSPYNVSPAAWRAALDACQPAFVHAHLAESTDELAWIAGEADAPIHRLHQLVLKKTFQPQTPGLSPVRYLHRFGLLTEGLIVAHCVFTDSEERELLAELGVRLAHCPRSNLCLQGRTLAWSEWEPHTDDVAIGLGTDSLLSTENLDLRAEARAAMACHGWTAGEALRRMTLEGARALGIEGRIGSLEPGKAADLAFWDVSDAAEGQTPEVMALSEITRWLTGRVAGKSLGISDFPNS